jgi:hypothetical protein
LGSFAGIILGIFEKINLENEDADCIWRAIARPGSSVTFSISGKIEYLPVSTSSPSTRIGKTSMVNPRAI